MSRSRIVDFIRWMDLKEIPADFKPGRFGKLVGDAVRELNIDGPMIEREHALLKPKAKTAKAGK